jgi:purine-nucleoside phosphorylase
MSWEPSIPEALRECKADTALILGSGLSSVSDRLNPVETVSFGEVAGLPESRVPGHAGRFLIARPAGRPLLIAQGRVHLYEGWDAAEVVRTVLLFHRLGVRRLLLTNAAGSLNPGFEPGGWMMLSDHINLTGQSPLRGGPHFIDMSAAYCPELRGRFRGAAASRGEVLHEGVYAAVAGPQYETPAEVRMLRLLGADAVGMSTVPEVIQAHALGMKVAAFSCLTNWAAGISGRPISHDEVAAAGREAAHVLAGLLLATMADL